MKFAMDAGMIVLRARGREVSTAVCTSCSSGGVPVCSGGDRLFSLEDRHSRTVDGKDTLHRSTWNAPVDRQKGIPHSRPELQPAVRPDRVARPGLSVRHCPAPPVPGAPLVTATTDGRPCFCVRRFYDPQHGRVLIGGNDLTDLTLSSVREAIAQVGASVLHAT